MQYCIMINIHMVDHLMLELPCKVTFFEWELVPILGLTNNVEKEPRAKSQEPHVGFLRFRFPHDGISLIVHRLPGD